MIIVVLFIFVIVSISKGVFIVKVYVDFLSDMNYIW